jgi:hypothetical protein
LHRPADGDETVDAHHPRLLVSRAEAARARLDDLLFAFLSLNTRRTARLIRHGRPSFSTTLSRFGR